jgi:Sulfotransferase domain
MVSSTRAVRARVAVQVRHAGRAQAHLTSPLRLRPSYLIVGAQRCGTTSLHRALAKHPDVAPPMLRKGLHFFDTQYPKGFAWYQGHFPLALPARLRRLARGTRPITGESSPYYMFHPLAPGRIVNHLPDVRLVVMLRDPVERAWSAYTHERARGFEVEDFERALDLEDSRLAGEVDRMTADPGYVSLAHRHQAYVHRGQYVEQLEVLRRLVGPARLLVIDSQRFFTSPAEEYAKVLHFLCLRQWTPAAFDRANARPRAGMAATVHRRLQAHFRPYDDALRAFLGWSPSWLG